MRSLPKTCTIVEHGGFTRGGAPSGNLQPLPERTFDALERFLLSSSKEAELMSLSIRRGAGKIIAAKSHVGLIVLKDGAAIEILPKIQETGASVEETKRIFLDMLKCLKDAPFKTIGDSSLRAGKLSLFEIFISMFVAEAAALAKKGLSSSYGLMESNEPFFKGKLNVPQNISKNSCHRERFYVGHDILSANQPENRLIKTALILLQSLCSDAQNQRRIKSVLPFFSAVELSKDIGGDFSKCGCSRNLSSCKRALSWCKIFLSGNSFTPFSGKESAIALLYPMEKVFESFVAERFRALAPGGIKTLVQASPQSLFDKPSGAFRLRPDIMLADGDKLVIIDAKWKALSESASNFGISSSDMYQMLAYYQKHKADKIFLAYPKPSWNVEEMSFSSEDGFEVGVFFIDLARADESVLRLLRRASLSPGKQNL